MRIARRAQDGSYHMDRHLPSSSRPDRETLKVITPKTALKFIILVVCMPGFMSPSLTHTTQHR